MPSLQQPSASLSAAPVLAASRAEPTRYRFADALRGIAVLGVLIVHTHQNFPTTVGGPIWGLGQYGVHLFYIVSAFSLMLSHRHRSKRESAPLRNYAMRRFFRIAPLFYVAVLIYLLKPYLLPAETAPVDLSHASHPIELWHVLSTVLFVNGWHYESINLVVPGGWSVAVESNFYLVLPLILYFTTSLRKTIAFALAAIVVNKALSSAVFYFVAPGLPPSELGLGVFVGAWLPAQLPVFAIGLMMFWILQRYPIPAEGSGSRNPPTVFFVGLFVSIALAACPMPALVNKVITYSVWMSCVLLFGALILSHRPYGFLVNRFTTYLGTVSYGAYLLHFVVIHLLLVISRYWLEPAFGFRPDFFSALTVVVLGAMALATLSYRYIETPGQELGRRWIRSLEARAKPAPSPLRVEEAGA